MYEFYCAACHRVMSFLSRAVNTSKQPACPRCAAPDLQRRASAFAISRGRKDEPAGEGLPDMDEARLEKALESLAGEAAGLNEDDPRQAAHLMRRLFDATGMPVGSGLEEALKRMESGEDPEKIEAEMGDVLEQADPFAGGGDAGGRGGIRRLRHMLPPTIDPQLYEM